MTGFASGGTVRAVSTVDEMRARMDQWDRNAWCLAALAQVLRGVDDGAGAAVLDAVGLADAARDAGELARQLGSQAAAPLIQIAAVLSGSAAAWSEQPDEALLAQGLASAQAAPMFAQFVLPQLDGLPDRLGREGAAMLDIGTGTGALAVAYCRQFPALRVVGLDVLPRVLTLAEQQVAASDVADRVELRQQSVADLADVDAYDLAWLPAPFVPPAPLRAGVRRVREGMRSGGWVMVGHAKFGGDDVENALNRYKTVAYGGTALDDDEARELLESAGFMNVRALLTPPAAPALTVGRAG